MKTQSFQDLKKEERFGIVIMGAGGELNEWIDGIADNLIKNKIVKENDKTKIFYDAYTLNNNIKGKKGRTDLVLIFSESADPNIGELAMWCLKMGSISWIDDFIFNYKNDYK